MGLRGTIASVVSAAFTALGDIPSSATYRRTTTTYTPSTGAATQVNSDTAITAVFTKFSELELGRNAGLQVTDVKMILQQSSLAITPNIQTDLVVYGSKTYNLVHFDPDPSAAIWVVQLRAP